MDYFLWAWKPCEAIQLTNHSFAVHITVTCLNIFGEVHIGLSIGYDVDLIQKYKSSLEYKRIYLKNYL